MVMHAIDTFFMDLRHSNTDWTFVISQDNLVEEVDGINTVPNEKQQHNITAGISNSFGFGGHNSVVAFAAFKE